MPIERELTPEELDHLAASGVDPRQYRGVKVPVYSADEARNFRPTTEQAPPQPSRSALSAILPTLKAHAGQYAGGGAGTLGGAALGAELGALGGPAAPVTVPLGAILGAVSGGLSGSYVGNKAQQAIVPTDTEQRLEQEAAQARQESPWTSIGTDIVASMLAAGGKPSLAAGKGLAGLLRGGVKAIGTPAERALASQVPELAPQVAQRLSEYGKNIQALRQAGTMAAVSPAIQLGTGLATGEMPSGKELAASSIGGALFSGLNPLGRKAFGVHTEPSPEPRQSTPWPDNIKPADIPGYALDPDKVTPWTAKDAEGKPVTSDKIVKAAYKKLVPPPERATSEDPNEYREQAKAREAYNLTSVEDMRKALHEAELAKVQQPTPTVAIPTTEPTAKIEPEKVPVVEPSKVETQTKPAEEEPALTPEQEKMAAEQDQKRTDFERARAEQIGEEQWNAAHQLAMVGHEQPPKPLNENAVRISANPETLIKSAVSRSESFDRNLYAPPQSSGGEGNKSIIEAIRVGPPIREFSNRVKFENGNSGTSVQHELTRIGAQKENLYNKLATHLLNIADKDALKVPITFDPTARNSYYHPKGDYIRIKTDKDHTILHEIIHATTSKKLYAELGDASHRSSDHPMLDEYLELGDNESIKELIRSFKEASKVDLSPDNYGLKNLHEFVSETLSNPKFANRLNNIKTTKGTTVFGRIVEAIKRLLGCNPSQGSLLERVLKPTEEIIKQERSGNKVESTSNENLYAPHTTKVEEHVRGGIVGRAFEDTVNKIRQNKVNPEGANKFADAVVNTHNDKDAFNGQWTQPIIARGRGFSGTQEERMQQAAYWQLTHKAVPPSSMFRTPEEYQHFVQTHKTIKNIADTHIAMKEPVMDANSNKRLMRKDPNYWPTPPAPKVIETMADSTKSAQQEAYHNSFVDFNKRLGMNGAEAEKAWTNFREGLAQLHNSQVGSADYFNASRRAHNSSLPPEMTIKGFTRAMSSYTARMAADMSAYKNIESNHEVLAALGQTHDAWGSPVKPDPSGRSIAGDPSVQAAMDEIRGERGGTMQQHIENKASGLFTAFFIGPQTQPHRSISDLFTSAAHYASNPYQMVRNLASTVSGYKEGFDHAMKGGAIKDSALHLRDFFDRNLTAAERIQALTASVRRAYGSEFVDHLNAGMLQTMFEKHVIPETIDKANMEDMSAMQRLRKLDPQWNKGKTYSPEEQQQLASRLIGYVHGTGDARTMPPWMIHDSEISGFFRLFHWGVSQTNRFFSEIVTPAKNGNIGPLFNALLGGVAGGLAIKEMRELIGGKKGQIPSLKEMAANPNGGILGNKSLLGYELISALSYTGFGGMLSTISKLPVDWIYKNTSQGATFPLDEVISDTGKTISDFTTAAANDPHFDWFDATKMFWEHMLTTNFQLGRVLYNQALNTGLFNGTPEASRKALADKLGELRRFRMVINTPYAETGEPSNPYMNIEQKKFHLEEDPMKAVQMLPGMIATIMQKYGDNPDVMMEKIKALKQSQYATMPSLETLPLQAMKYIGYLQQKEGPEYANAALMDFMRHKMLNEAKASVVP